MLHIVHYPSKQSIFIHQTGEDGILTPEEIYKNIGGYVLIVNHGLLKIRTDSLPCAECRP